MSEQKPQVTLPETDASRAFAATLLKADQAFAEFGALAKSKKSKLPKGAEASVLDEIKQERIDKARATFKQGLIEVLDEHAALEKATKDGIVKLNQELDKLRTDLNKKLKGLLDMFENTQASNEQADTLIADVRKDSSSAGE